MKKLKMATTTCISFKEACEKYLLDCQQRNLREGTINHYKQSYIYFYNFINPKQPLPEIVEVYSKIYRLTL